jgi:hypothetical protein
MRNEGTGLCMSSLGTRTAGTVALQEVCNGSNNQYWYGEGHIGGIYLKNNADGWCLTNRYGAATAYNYQTMWPCGAPYYKQTYLTSGGGPGGSFKMAALKSNLYPNGYCVTSNGDTRVGSPIVEQPCNTSPNQYWSGPITVVG